MPLGKLEHGVEFRNYHSVNPMDAARRSLVSWADCGISPGAQQVLYEAAMALYRDGRANRSWPEAWRQAKAAVADLIRTGDLAAPKHGPLRPVRHERDQKHGAA